MGVRHAFETAEKPTRIGRRTAYDWREADEDFAKDWEDAVEAGTDALEDVAIERAKNSSDTMLIFMLKARRPEKFRENRTYEHRGPSGGPVQFTMTLHRDESA